METKKNVTWTTRDGRKATAQITKLCGVQENVVNADGDKITVGRKPIDSLTIEVFLNGELRARAYGAPYNLTERDLINNPALAAAGAYARLGDLFINQVQYDLVTDAITELEKMAFDTTEYAFILRKETEQEAARVEEEEENKFSANDPCPRCLTWCYGDCQL